jgi:hypothetical protein
LSSEIGKTCERFIIIKGEKNRFAKWQTARTNMELPVLSTIEGASIGRRGKLLNEIRGGNATRVAKKAQGRGRKRRWSTVIWKWSTYPMWYELTNDPGKFFRMPWRVTYKRPKRVPAETKEKRAMYYKRQKGGKPLKE